MKAGYILLLIFLLSPGINEAQRVLKTNTPVGGINLVTTGVPHNPYMTKKICLPNVITTNPYNVTLITADCGGTIFDAGGDPGGIIARGVCWSIFLNPTLSDAHSSNGTGTGNFLSLINNIDLLNNTLYHVRAYATNSLGTAYGNDVAFTSIPNCGTVTDIDGNVYSTVKINSKCYTRENLFVTRYYDGTAIPRVDDNAAWAGLSSGAYAYYSNSDIFKIPYGALYNWYAVNSGLLCPNLDGWHVPSQSELQSLSNYLLGASAADFLKEAGNAHWLPPHTGTNGTGFTALPSGYRAFDGSFSLDLNTLGYYWTTTSYNTNLAYFVQFSYTSSSINLVSSIDKRYGASVRCMKDSP